MQCGVDFWLQFCGAVQCGVTNKKFLQAADTKFCIRDITSAQSLVTVVVFPGLDRSGRKFDLKTRIEKIFDYVSRWMPFLSQPSPFIQDWDRHQGCSDLNKLRGWVVKRFKICMENKYVKLML